MHNAANELASATAGPIDTLPRTWTHDPNGNRARERRTSGMFTQDEDYFYDAWNRLVRVRPNGATTQSVHTASYNGLGWRVWKKWETSKGTQTDVDEQRFYAYGAGWQLLEERIDTDLDASIERVGQQVWGVRYIDDAVAKRLDRLNDGSWDASYVYLTDAQFSVRALAETSLSGAAEIVERVAYTPYGEARHRYAGDMDGDGDVDTADISAIPGSGYVADLDADNDGSNADDTSGWLIPRVSSGLYATAVPDGWLSDPGLGSTVGTDNSIGYAGYVADFETGDYHVRNRRLDPATGRWFQRDAFGYIDGSNLYQYARSMVVVASDPYGLKLTIKSDKDQPLAGDFAQAVVEALEQILGPCWEIRMFDIERCKKTTRGRQKRTYYNYICKASLDIRKSSSPDCDPDKQAQCDPCVNEIRKAITQKQEIQINNGRTNAGQFKGKGRRKVFWNPTLMQSTWNDPGGDGDLVWEEAPPAITLWHEIMHALHGMSDTPSGLLKPGFVNPMMVKENMGRACFSVNNDQLNDRYTGPSSYIIDSRSPGNEPGDTLPRPQL